MTQPYKIYKGKKYNYIKSYDTITEALNKAYYYKRKYKSAYFIWNSKSEYGIKYALYVTKVTRMGWM